MTSPRERERGAFVTLNGAQGTVMRASLEAIRSCRRAPSPPANVARWLECVVATALLHAAAGCHPSSATTAHDPPHPHGSLVDVVPAAGLRWLVAGSPRQLAASPALAPLREHWLTETRRQAFARMTGIDLWVTDRALAAGFDLGTLYMADASGWVAPPERLFIDRLAGSERIEQPQPHIWRISGVAGTEPETLVRLADEWVAVAIGDPTLARVVELRAQRRLERVVPALDGASLSALPEDVRRPGPLAVYVPGPIDRDWLSDGSSLLASTQALALTLELDDRRVALSVTLAGQWQPERDLPRLAAAWRAFGASTVGQQLALDRPSEPVETTGSETLLRARTQLEGGAFATGVERLFAGKIGDLTF